MVGAGDELLAVGGVVALVLAFVFAAALGARRRREFRARILEVLARAVARDLPLAPLFQTASGEFSRRQGRALLRAHEALMRGAGLGEACVRAGRRLFPRHVVSAIRAAEGTGGLPHVLQATADDSTESHVLRHRVVLALLYPALLLFVVWSIQGLALHRLNEVRSVLETTMGGRLFDMAGTAMRAALWLVPLGLGAWWLLHRLGLVPGARLRARGRMLRSLAVLVRAGVALPDALRRCGHADKADSIEAGEPVASVLCIPAGRAALPDALETVAGDCLRRYRTRVDRCVRWLNPVAVVLTAVLAAMVMMATFQMIQGVRLEAWPW